MKDTPPRRESTLQVAGEAVALLAGVVAAVYSLGGLVLAVRLLSDGFSVDAVLLQIGLAPRELVVSAGLVQALGPAAVMGIGAALVYGVTNGPNRRSRIDNDRLTQPPNAARTIFGLVALSAVLIAPGVVLSERTDEVSTGEAVACLVALLVTIPLVFAGWFVKRRVARRRSWYRISRAVVGGAIWAAMAVIPAVLAVGALPFEKAQLCLETPDKMVKPLGREDQLTLIAQTKDRTILAVEKSTGDNRKAKSLLTVPTTKVSRLQFGKLARNLNCVNEI